MEIDRSDAQQANADSPSVEIAQPASKVRSESFAQPQKQALPIVSTDEGMQIERSDEHP
jgi:hypothetical protein